MVIPRLKQQRDIEQLKLIADVELEYVTAWEKARYEQNALRGDMEIEKLERILNDCRVREKNDERVHTELTKFLIQETAVSTRTIASNTACVFYSLHVARSNLGDHACQWNNIYVGYVKYMFKLTTFFPNIRHI